MKSQVVALLAEGVDRNRYYNVDWLTKLWVALLAEGVDRNSGVSGRSLDSFVALLAEGVDRNIYEQLKAVGMLRRPPRGGRG